MPCAISLLPADKADQPASVFERTIIELQEAKHMLPETQAHTTKSPKEMKMLRN